MKFLVSLIVLCCANITVDACPSGTGFHPLQRLVSRVASARARVASRVATAFPAPRVCYAQAVPVQVVAPPVVTVVKPAVVVTATPAPIVVKAPTAAVVVKAAPAPVVTQSTVQRTTTVQRTNSSSCPGGNCPNSTGYTPLSQRTGILGRIFGR